MDTVMNGAEGSEISGGGLRVECAWLLVWRLLGTVRRVGGRPKCNGGTFG